MSVMSRSLLGGREHQITHANMLTLNQMVFNTRESKGTILAETSLSKFTDQSALKERNWKEENEH